MTKTIHGVIFDLGSTLIRFDGDWPILLQDSLDLLIDQLQEDGLDFDRSDFRSAFECALEAYDHQRQSNQLERSTASLLQETLSTFGHEEISPDILRRGLKRFYSVSETHWRPMPALHAVLDELQEEGRMLGLISNAGDAENVQRLIDKAEIRDYFDPIIISAAIGIRKPDPILFEMVLDQWQVNPESIVMIGDRLEADILGAQNTGIHQIWLKPEAEVSAATQIIPEKVTGKLVDIPGLIREFEAKGQ
ncbi:MAG: HAD family hydrolase [Anaerolineales bacterium]|jgi:HAD superfamily hydrolase (TIGR01549 family)|nr:MAG: HAD family hydrolase [Anaerolineales bacterium]